MNFLKKDKLYRKEMKPPYYPPNDKMIKDAAIRAMEKEARPILDEVVVSKYFLNKKIYK